MSRQSKQTKKQVLAKQFTAIRTSGGHGPARTKKLSGKVNTWYKAKKVGKPVSHNSYTDEAVS